MKSLLSILILFSISSLSAEQTTDEFTYIQPITVEKVSIQTPVVEAKAVEEEIVEESTQTKDIVNDNDNDGVVDEKDKCPNTPQGAEVNERGCELDSDEDGVRDSKDKCPDTSKDFVVDNDGCPKTAILKINFATGKYNITDSYKDTIQEFTNFLLENTGYQVIIYGHTDSNGNEVHNKELSINRAKSVMNSFIKNDIERVRITAIGKSSNEPIADNETEEGREQNRRIEVELLR